MINIKQIQKKLWLILLVYIVILLCKISCIYLYANLFPDRFSYVNLTDFSQISFFGIILIFLAVFWEEFIFRYLAFLPGWIGAGWLLFFPYLTVTSLGIKFFGYQRSIFDTVYIAICLLFLLWVEKNKDSGLYNIFFKLSRFKIIVSAFVFSLAHLSNYNLTTTNFALLASYVLLLNIPFSLLESYIQLKFKHGFWLAVLLHFVNNLLPLLPYFL
jgi:membrane protease YdiL (CAAX protease family)